jgi:hypothetical protein
MKRFIIIFISLLISSVAISQTMSFPELFDKYAKADECKSVYMTAKMITTMASASNDAKLVKLLEGIKSIRIISAPISNKDFSKDINSYIKNNNLPKLSSRYSDNRSDDFYFYNGGKSAKNSEFIMYTTEPNKITVVRIYGIFDVKDISKLSKITN